MAGESLIIGNGNWGVKSGNLLGYNLNGGNYVPRELTFTRATTGTRTNGALLVENTPYNLVQYSEQFENAAWTKIGSGLGTTPIVTSNFAIAPNGSLTADRIQCSNIGGSGAEGNYSLVLQSNIPLSASGTLSIYLKSLTGVTQNVLVYWAGGQGTVFQVTSQWQRFTIPNLTPPTSGISLGTRGGVGWYTGGDAVIDIAVWGAQIVEGPLPLTYLPTTTRLNIPRIDYSTGTAALLMEPQRTNIVLRSEEFDSASWAKSGATVIANDTIAPNGLLAADRITQSGATINFNQIISLTAGVVTFTTYVKKGNFDSSSSFLFGLFSTVTADIGYISFSFLTGTTTVYSGTFISHSATNVGNGWYRIQGTINVPSTGLGYFYNGGVGLTIAGVGSYYYSWGAQVEVGSSATSYIPTTSASVTRNADTFTRSGFQSEGLLTPTQNTFVFDISSTATTGSNFNFINFTATSGLPIVIWKFAANQNFNIQISGTFIDTGVKFGKFAVVQSGSQTKLFVNGVLNTTGAATGIINAIGINIDLYQLASPCLIKSLTMYPTALSDAECINITK